MLAECKVSRAAMLTRPYLIGCAVQWRVAGALHLVHVLVSLDELHNACAIRATEYVTGRAHLLILLGRGCHWSVRCSQHAVRVIARSLSWLLTAQWISIFPTVPRPRWEPPPSSLQPTGPSHFGKGPCTFFHQGFFSTMLRPK